VGILPILCQISNLSDVGEGEDSLARGTPRKATTGQNLQQLDEVPRSLGGRSRKAKKVARNGTTKSWENRVGRNQFGHLDTRALKVLKPKLLLRAISIKNFLGL